MKRSTLIAVVVIAILAVAIILYRRKKAAAGTTAPSMGGTASSGIPDSEKAGLPVYVTLTNIPTTNRLAAVGYIGQAKVDTGYYDLDNELKLNFAGAEAFNMYGAVIQAAIDGGPTRFIKKQVFGSTITVPDPTSVVWSKIRLKSGFGTPTKDASFTPGQSFDLRSLT